jgi:hypothetical protein
MKVLHEGCSNDDEYVLFGSVVGQQSVRPTLLQAFGARPQNVVQLLHVSTVTLFNHVHKYELRRAEPGSFGLFRTILVFIYLCRHCFSTSDVP